MAFSDAFLDELRLRAPIADIIGRHVALKRTGHRLTGLCPFHKEKTPSFSVNEKEGFYHCFGCKASGTAVTFLRDYERLHFREAVAVAARAAGMRLPDESPEDRARQERGRAAEKALAVADAYYREQLRGPAGAKARAYLESRGVAGATVELFGLGYAPANGADLRRRLAQAKMTEEVQESAGLLGRSDSGQAYPFFRDRLMFPIADRRGRTIAFGGRALGEARAKYLNSPDGPLFHKRLTLYNLHRAAEAARDGDAGVRVVEGYMDVIALHEAGFPAAVAPLGTALTVEQVQLAWRYDDEPVICMDGDEAGRRAATASAERVLPGLRPGRSVRFAFLPSGEDPDSLFRRGGAGALRAVFDDALSLADLVWTTEFERHALDTPERRAHLLDRLDKLVRTIGDGMVRDAYRTFFAQRVSGHQLGPPARRFRGRGGGGRFPSGAPAAGEAPEADRIPARRHRNVSHRAAVQRERAIVRAVINVSGLLDRAEEDFAHVPLSVEALDKVRREVLNMHVQGSSIDPASVRSCLERHGIADLADCAAAAPGWEGRSVAEPFTRPGADPDEAFREWKAAVQCQHEWHDGVQRRGSGQVPAAGAAGPPPEPEPDEASEIPL